MLPKLRDDIAELLLAAQAPGARASVRFRNSGVTLGSPGFRVWNSGLMRDFRV